MNESGVTEIYPVREFFCRECGVKEEDTTIPVGWVVVRRRMINNPRPVTVGIYCGLICQLISALRNHRIGMVRNIVSKAVE